MRTMAYVPAACSGEMTGELPVRELTTVTRVTRVKETVRFDANQTQTRCTTYNVTCKRPRKPWIGASESSQRREISLGIRLYSGCVCGTFTEPVWADFALILGSSLLTPQTGRVFWNGP